MSSLRNSVNLESACISSRRTDRWMSSWWEPEASAREKDDSRLSIWLRTASRPLSSYYLQSLKRQHPPDWSVLGSGVSDLFASRFYGQMCLSFNKSGKKFVGAAQHFISCLGYKRTMVLPPGKTHKMCVFCLDSDVGIQSVHKTHQSGLQKMQFIVLSMQCQNARVRRTEKKKRSVCIVCLSKGTRSFFPWSSISHSNRIFWGFWLCDQKTFSC